MNDSEPEIPTPDTPLGAVADRVVSRRKVVQAGLIAVPVLMTLPVVPAWAGGNKKKNNFDPNQAVNSACTSQGTPTTSRPSCTQPGAPAGMQAAPSSPDAFGKNPFATNPFEN